MGRKAFINDLRDAASTGRFAQISSVTTGDDDGTLKFLFQPTALPAEAIAVDAMVSDVSDYPSDHTYFLYTTSENVVTAVTTAIESVQSSVAGQSISHMLIEASTAINRALSGDQPNVGADFEDSDAVDEDDRLSEDESDADMWSSSPPSEQRHIKGPINDLSTRSSPSKATKARIKSDLRLVKEAGFKTGVLGNLELGGILCISTRIAKLGISDEALSAWAVKRNHYLVLLIRYTNGYKSLEEVKEESISAASKTEFRVALCQQYKPAIKEAVSAFNQLPVKSNVSDTVVKGPAASADTGTAPGSLEPLFIGRPLNDLLTRLPPIIKYRIACAFSWTGAELFFNEIQAKAAGSIDVTLQEFNVSDQPASQASPAMVTADHLCEKLLPRSMSFPLAAMQFVLRHFVRCTEFCLVCHCKIDSNFEALKPYVCSKPLCLFQYMTLGFGPSIEWEILSQPYVVDLLISFCYASAQGRRLKDFPIGIDLKVPPLLPSLLPSSYYQPRVLGSVLPASLAAPSTTASPVIPQPMCSKFDPKAGELRFDSPKLPGPLRAGDWVVVTMKGVDGAYHARVEQNFFPTIRLGELIYLSSSESRAVTTAASKIPVMDGLVDVEVFVYDQNFDELSDDAKQITITSILSTLPDVMEMKAFLESRPQDPSLKRYGSRISDTALNLLRWIIASNRSCIMQVDRSASSALFAGVEDRVSGMGDWMQFRFAQGSPDKEQRFMDCVKEVSTRLSLDQFPTLFAWHGSPLANWHSIVREGLHFNDTVNGRAYGHGVYMSHQAGTSVGYSGFGRYPANIREGGISSNWPNSKLCVSAVLALNEVVNAPAEFVNSTPHYVVNQVDWIQSRYLFVRGNHRQLGHDFGTSSPPKHVYAQDPTRVAVDEKGQPIIIPITAVSKSRRPATVSSPLPLGAKKAKVTGSTTQEQAEKTEDDASSMVTNDSDHEILFSDADDDDDDTATTFRASPSRKKESRPTQPGPSGPPPTDFIPGQLVASTLPLLAPPANASTSATRTLLTALKQLLAVQESNPLHELGWYLDSSLITNTYQWPVELHSFPTELPLAADMRAVGLKSIVLEIRFSNTFPMSPPFVRVIRPRFLPFAFGGGGHVTGGGALCMELLTNSGWSPVSSLEGVLLQVRMAICSTDPKPARLEGRPADGTGAGGMRLGRSAGAVVGVYGGANGGGEYQVGEAVEAYKRACALHGWQVPKEFDDFLKG